MVVLKSLRKLDTWLLEKRLRWRAAFLTFAVMTMIVAASMFIDGGEIALVVMALYVAFGLRYIRPNIG